MLATTAAAAKQKIPPPFLAALSRAPENYQTNPTASPGPAPGFSENPVRQICQTNPSIAQLSKKPHPGLALPTAALYPGPGSAISSTASALAASVYDFHVRSRCTGKERDAETGLDFFGARYFSGPQGRWTSTDPISGWPSQPQSWNRYAYALNNPLRYVDPNGLASFDANGNWIGGYNGERDCSTNNGCLYWNSNTQQWEQNDPNSPPSLFDLPGQFFVGFTALAVNNDPHELWRIPYSIGADLTGGALLSKGLQAGATWLKLRNAKFAQRWARDAFSKGGKFAGQTVDDVARALQTGVLDPSDVPVEFVQGADGTPTLLNTRSSVALTISGVPTPLWKLVDATSDLGANLRLAGQLANNAGAPASSVVLVPSSRVITIGH